MGWVKAVNGSLRSDYPHDGYHRGDLLASIAPPFHQRGGVDMLVSKVADGGRGVTLLLQNPYGSPVVVRVTVRPELARHKDVVEASLSPLETAVLTVPVMLRAGTEIEVMVSSEGAAGPRLREAGASKLDLPHSALGILGGLATLALTPVGHFSVTRRGGDVPNPFTAKWELESKVAPASLARYERLWAPADAGPQSVGYVRRVTARGHELTVVGYVVAAIAAIIAATFPFSAIRLVTGEIGGPVAYIAGVVYIAIAIGVGVAVALGLDRARVPILTQRPTSAISMLGAGLRDA
jgi:hypothetical protein